MLSLGRRKTLLDNDVPKRSTIVLCYGYMSPRFNEVSKRKRYSPQSQKKKDWGVYMLCYSLKRFFVILYSSTRLCTLIPYTVAYPHYACLTLGDWAFLVLAVSETCHSSYLKTVNTHPQWPISTGKVKVITCTWYLGTIVVNSPGDTPTWWWSNTKWQEMRIDTQTNVSAIRSLYTPERNTSGDW